jgi:hypothetical protein
MQIESITEDELDEFRRDLGSAATAIASLAGAASGLVDLAQKLGECGEADKLIAVAKGLRVQASVTQAIVEEGKRLVAPIDNAWMDHHEALEYALREMPI